MAALPNRAPAQSIVLVVLLYIRPGKEAEYRAYAAQAAALMAEYGGDIQQAMAPYAVLGKLRAPDEVHLITFPDQAALAAYESDPRAAALRVRRDDALADTILILGRPASRADA